MVTAISLERSRSGVYLSESDLPRLPFRMYFPCETAFRQGRYHNLDHDASLVSFSEVPSQNQDLFVDDL